MLYGQCHPCQKSGKSQQLLLQARTDSKTCRWPVPDFSYQQIPYLKYGLCLDLTLCYNRVLLNTQNKQRILTSLAERAYLRPQDAIFLPILLCCSYANMFKLSIDKKLLDFLWCCILKEGVHPYGQGSNKIHVINRKKLVLEGIFRFSALFSHNQSYQQLCGRNGELNCYTFKIG